jgi:hypothetical protein
MKMQRSWLALGVMGLLAACGSDDPAPVSQQDTGPSLDEAFLVAGLPSSVVAQESLSIANARPGRDSAQTPSTWSRVGGLQASFIAGTTVFDGQPGEETQLQPTDVNGDGLVDQEIRVFKTPGGSTFLAWEGATVVGEGDEAVQVPSACHLLWQEAGGRYYVRSGCEASAGLACRIDSAPERCTYCTAAACVECDVTDGIVRCDEPTVPDVPDTGTPDSGTPTPDSGTPVDAGGDAPTIDTGGTDSGGPVEAGECDPACLLEFETECCTGCGCTAFDCTPQCPSGTEWDCEQQCCFNFDVQECG